MALQSENLVLREQVGRRGGIDLGRDLAVGSAIALAGLTMGEGQALAAGGGDDPGGEAARLADGGELFEQGDADGLKHVGGVGFAEPILERDRIDERGVAVDEAIPGGRVTPETCCEQLFVGARNFCSACHARPY